MSGEAKSVLAALACCFMFTALVVLVALAARSIAGSLQQQLVDECKQRGGTAVRSQWGLVCARLDIIELKGGA